MVSIDEGGERLTEILVRDRSKIRKVWAAVARRWPGGGAGSSLVADVWRMLLLLPFEKGGGKGVATVDVDGR